MKTGIHPQVFEEATVTCSCGATFVTGSTKEAIRVDLCSKCHPFYTGTQKLVDTEGKVEKFTRQRKVAEEKKALYVAKKQTEDKQRSERPDSLAAMVAAIRKQQKSS